MLTRPFALFVGLIESLPSAERELWNKATIRDFNIGVQAGSRLIHEIILAAAPEGRVDVGARIVFTVYAPELVKCQSSK